LPQVRGQNSGRRIAEIRRPQKNYIKSEQELLLEEEVKKKKKINEGNLIPRPSVLPVSFLPCPSFLPFPPFLLPSLSQFLSKTKK
jgi:hypothetical protein